MTPERFTASEKDAQSGDDAAHAPPSERPSTVNEPLTPHVDDLDRCTSCGATEAACDNKRTISGRRCCYDVDDNGRGCSHAGSWW
jgi:hypothetical protein